METPNAGQKEIEQEFGTVAVYVEPFVQQLWSPKVVPRAPLKRARLTRFSFSRSGMLLLLSALAWVFVIRQCIDAALLMSHRVSGEWETARRLAQVPYGRGNTLMPFQDNHGNPEGRICGPGTYEDPDPFQNIFLDQMYGTLLKMEAEESSTTHSTSQNLEFVPHSEVLPRKSNKNVEGCVQLLPGHSARDLDTPHQGGVESHLPLDGGLVSSFRSPKFSDTSPVMFPTQSASHGSDGVVGDNEASSQLSSLLALQRTHVQKTGKVGVSRAADPERSPCVAPCKSATVFEVKSNRAAGHREGVLQYLKPSSTSVYRVGGAGAPAESEKDVEHVPGMDHVTCGSQKGESDTLSIEDVFNLPKVLPFPYEWKLSVEEIGSSANPANFALTTVELECRLQKKELSETHAQFVLDMAKVLLIRLPRMTFAEKGSVSIRRKARSAGVLVRGVAVLFRVTELFPETVNPEFWWEAIFKTIDVDALQARGEKVMHANKEYIAFFRECINILQHYRMREPPEPSVLLRIIEIYNEMYRNPMQRKPT